MLQTEIYKVKVEMKVFGEGIQREKMIFVKSFTWEWTSTTVSRIIKKISKIEYGDQIEGLKISIERISNDEVYSGIKADVIPYKKLTKEIKEKIKKIMRS